MEENEAPKKLYVDIEDGFRDSFLYGYVEKHREDDIEYTRTDAFIEKACEWLKNNIEKYYYLDEAYDKVISIKNLNNDFKNYIKGE